MPGIRKFTKVFIGSPGDLAEERRIARSVVDEFNSQLAETLGYQVDLVGWEDTLPGIGRPQAIINRDLDGCDLFVGMLWKRWGTPPGHDAYTSGFEEEFERSLERSQRTGSPAISLLFKDVEPSLLLDPGQHLSKVEDFKKRVFSAQSMLCGTFKDVSAFEKAFRKIVNKFVAELRARDIAADEKAGQISSDQAKANPALSTEVASDGGRSTSTGTEAAFLRAFAAQWESIKDDEEIPVSDVARLRLISAIQGQARNDDDILGTHDCNLLFKSRNEYDYSDRELRGLSDAGLTHFSSETVPLWFWLSSIKSSIRSHLTLSTFLGSEAHQAGAIRAMRFIGEPASDELPRDMLLDFWLGKGTARPIRLAALKYLGDFGVNSDIPRMRQEFDRNDTQTTSEAADAIVRLHLKSSASEALRALLELQPSRVDDQLISLLFSRPEDISEDLLLEGARCSIENIRAASVRVLFDLGRLASIAEQLVADGNAEIRYRSLLAIQNSGRPFTLEEARRILVRPVAPATFGFLAMNQRDESGERWYEEFEKVLGSTARDESLRAEAEVEIYNINAYLALARKHWAAMKGEVRAAALDGFSDRFDKIYRAFSERYAGTDLPDKVSKLKDYLCSTFTVQAMTLICGMGDKSDLSLVRKFLQNEKAGFCAAAIPYIAKFGSFPDIALIVSSLSKSDPLVNGLLLQYGARRYEAAAVAIATLARGNLDQALNMRMPSSVLAKLIAQIGAQEFKALTRKSINALLGSKDEKVRKAVALKAAFVLTKVELKSLLDEYMKGESHFYNVIHWLDFGISVSRPVAKASARRALSEI